MWIIPVAMIRLRVEGEGEYRMLTSSKALTMFHIVKHMVAALLDSI